MAKNKKYQQISPETQEQAMRSAKATQRPGQTKEQTKLIAQGIQKGIDHYKKQQKSKSRELNKKINKVSQRLTDLDEGGDSAFSTETVPKKSVLPWVLLLVSWLGFIAYFLNNFI